MSRAFRPVSITLTEPDRQRLLQLAKINHTNSSDMVRQMIRGRRLPRNRNALAEIERASTPTREGALGAVQ